MNIFSQIFGNKKEPAASKKTPDMDVIVAKFGEIIATRSPPPIGVADVNELPYSKNHIKSAILLMLATTRDPKLQEHLQNAYLLLARWQEGVGPAHKGFDPSKLDRTQPPEDLAKQILDRMEEMKKWQPMIDADQKALLDELRTACPGFGKLGRS